MCVFLENPNILQCKLDCLWLLVNGIKTLMMCGVENEIFCSIWHGAHVTFILIGFFYTMHAMTSLGVLLVPFLIPLIFGKISILVVTEAHNPLRTSRVLVYTNHCNFSWSIINLHILNNLKGNFSTLIR